MRLSRLSDQCIECDITRALLYRDIKQDIANNRIKTAEYEVKIDELYRPDLTAYRATGDVVLKWLVMILADIEDDEQPMPIGKTLHIPDNAYLREKIRHYSEGGEAYGTISG